MIDFGLMPCPLCGGEAEVARLTQGPKELTAVIKCTDCGLTLEWETDIAHSISRSGKTTAVKRGLDPIEAWNRRELCQACAERINSTMVAALPDCNTCGIKWQCEHMPAPGQMVRINCPLWRAVKEENTEKEAAEHGSN